WAWQRVDAGNATDEVAGSSMRVLLTSLPGRGDLIGNVFIEPDVITPNGDGVNDRMDLAFSVFKVDRDRRVTARIYDVGGIPVRRIGDWRGASRNYEAIWDGRDEEGDLVSPGLYLLRIEVDGDAGDKMVSKVVSVVY
ncbi:MAG: gliding motility-associated C-terminal domain-containing protein, partial [Candidatus Latescibacteria bacterium]|nr:gliding motility-associated C-terminal domain-containing protein [Candidatus Latescibacterota bacterium]